MQVFSKEKIPKGYMGVVAPDGTFYAIAKTGTIDPSHQINLSKLSRELEKNKYPNIHHLFRSCYDRIKDPEEFFLLDSFDYKAGFIDLYGFCNYESKGRDNSFAAINIPRPEINGKKITKEQRDTLINLVRLNNDNIESLRIIFLDNNKSLRDIANEAMLPNSEEQYIRKVMGSGD